MKHIANIVFVALLVLLGIAPLHAQQTPFVMEMPHEQFGVCRTDLPYYWRGIRCETDSAYKDTVRINGKGYPRVDTLKIYTLDFHPMPILNERVEINAGSRFVFRNKSYTEEGEYWDTIPGVECDSLVHLSIVYGYYWHLYDTAHVCEGTPYTRWRGRTLTEPGDYFDSLLNVNGKDSIYQLHLMVHYPVETWDTLNVCRSEEYYRWNGKRLREDGDYTMSLKSPYSCDSIAHLHLTFIPVPEITRQTEYFCSNIGIVLHGKAIYNDTIVMDTLPAFNRCDSIIETHYIPRPSQLYEQVLQHYEGEPVTWRGKTYSEDGVYWDSLTNVYECDSVYQLRVVTKYDTYITINRCQGDEVLHFKQPVTHDTIFVDTLRTQMGGDSLVHTTYNFVTAFHSYESISICSNQYVVWEGHGTEEAPMILHEAGIYRDAHHKPTGCDSIYEIEVTVLPAWLHDTVVIYCNDSLDLYGPFRWTDSKGVLHEWSQHNVDTIICDTMSHTMPETLTYHPDGEGWTEVSGGCDSINRIRIIVTDRCSPLERIPLCYGESVRVDDRIYTKPGRYWNQMPSSRNLNLRDSTHTFEIYYVYPTEETISLTVCESELPYNYHGHKLTEEGMYDIHLETQYKCDSLIHLDFHITPTKYSPIQELQFCPSEGFRLELHSGRVITTPGEYKDTFQLLDGCDSIVQIRIRWAETNYYSDTAYFLQGTNYTWHRDGLPRVLDTEGVYWDSCKNVFGCDSVYRLYLKEAEPFYYKDSMKVCSSQFPLIWHGKLITEEKTYFDSLKTHFGMDSVYEMKVLLYPSYVVEKQITLCPGEEFHVGGTLVTGNVYTDEQQSVNGCDSVTIYYINRNSIQTHSETLHFAAESVFEWREKPYTHGGYYYDTLWSSLGCDSVVYALHLIEEYPFHDEEDVTTCLSDGYYDWRGQHLSETGVYYDSLTTWFGLDSVYQLNLTVHQPYFRSETHELCPGGDMNFGQLYVTEPGIYVESGYTQYGCDSIVRHIVNPARTYYMDEVLTYVDDSELPIHWHGKDLTGEGYYFDSLTTTTNGCDSIHRVLVIQKSSYLYETFDTICAGDYYDWRGRRCTQADTYYDRFTSVHGMDSVYVLHLHVNSVSFTRWNATLCDKQTYMFFGRPLTQPGTYRDTLRSMQTGCDSIFEVIINPMSTQETFVNHILCEGDKLHIGNTDVTEAGTYRDTLTAVLTGCDSIVCHIVTVGKSYFRSEERTVNPQQTFMWHHCGQPVALNAPGTYWDSCTTVLGCDSIQKLTLKWNQTEYIFPTDTDHVCSADLPYIWHGRSLTQTGLYYDSLKTNQGRDSVYSFYLDVFITKHTQQTLAYCEGERPVINGMPYERDAVFTDTLISAQGCDSIVDYILHFHPRYSMTVVADIHDGDTYQFGDTVIRTTGVYHRRFETVYGCDSLVTLRIKSCPKATEVVVHHDMCEGEQFQVAGKYVSTSGSFYETRAAVTDGCDSLIHYIVNVRPSYLYTTNASFCRGSSYTWHGHRNDTVVTKQGVYYDSLKTITGCDSVYCLKLTYRRTDVRDTIITVCTSDLPYRFGNKYFYNDSIFVDTLPNNMDGCDSLLRWNYRICDHCSDYVTYNHCEGETMYVEGMLIEQQGAYRINRLTADGQDSIFRFIVRDVPNYEITTRLNGCDSIVYDGRTYHARGAGRETYTVDLTHRTVDGCDSIEHLELTIYMSSPVHTYTRTIADYDSILFGNRYFNTEGEYSIPYFNTHGCDSIEVLKLHVLETQYPDIVHYYFCEGDNRGVEVFGRLYHPTEEYTYISDTTQIASQPVVRTADITMQHPFAVVQFDPDEDQIICSANEVLFYVNYRTRDQSILPDYYSVDFLIGDLEAHPLHQEGEVGGKTTLPIVLNGQGRYVHPGNYSYRLTLRSESCVSSDTILQGSIMVRYPDDIMESAWNDAVMLVNERYNGGAWVLKAPYRWQVLSSQGVDKTARVVTDVTQPYLYSSELAEGDRITAFLYREGYSKAIPSCEYVFVPTLPLMPHAILVSPSAVQRRMPVSVQAHHAGNYRLVDHTGRTCSSGYFTSGTTQIHMPATQGCYMMLLDDEAGNHKVQKLIVY